MSVLIFYSFLSTLNDVKFILLINNQGPGAVATAGEQPVPAGLDRAGAHHRGAAQSSPDYPSPNGNDGGPLERQS